MTEDTSTLRPSRGRAELAAPPDPASAAIFARQVLVFPLLVVILACTSFLFGGRCAAWQWWTAVAAVVAAPFVRKDCRRAALKAAGLFALLLFALRCLIPPLLLDDTFCPDMTVYHLPMIQLLIEGWNPVSDPTAEGISSSLGLDLWGMAPLHVAFLPKTMAVFSAVTYTFVRDPFALTFPGPFLLWLGVLLAAATQFRGFARWALVAAVAGILPMVAWQLPVDLELAFASGGLLLAMQISLRREKCDWLALTVWGAWMMNVKLNGVLAAFVFCALFVSAKTWKERAEWKRWIGRFVAFGGVLILLWGAISWNPLGVSWQRYGHPLYPFKTADGERFPVQDLTWDLQGGNEDYHEMSRAGLLARAYLSPQATDAFYRWKLGRKSFKPIGVWWSWKEATDAHVRLELWLTFVVLLLLPAGRIWGIGGLLLAILVPKSMIGFTRYQPWFSALGCLAVLLAAEWAEARLDRRLTKALSTLVAIVLVALALQFVCRHTYNVECKAVESMTTRERIRAPFWYAPIEFRKQLADVTKDFVPRYDYLSCKKNRTRLLVKELGSQTIVESADRVAQDFGLDLDWDERDWRSVKDREKTESDRNESSPQSVSSQDEKNGKKSEMWRYSPFGYWIPQDEKAEHIEEYFAQTGASNNNGSHHPKSKLATFLRAWFAVYPREVWRRL